MSQHLADGEFDELIKANKKVSPLALSTWCARDVYKENGSACSRALSRRRRARLEFFCNALSSPPLSIRSHTGGRGLFGDLVRPVQEDQPDL